MSRHRRKRTQQRANHYDEVVGPAVITDLHTQDRETSTVAGAPKAWRKLKVLEKAYRQERLGPIDSKLSRQRFSAGCQYTDLWDRSQRALRDSTDILASGRGEGSGLPLGEAARAALSRLEVIEGHLGRNDLTIVRCVLAWGYSIPEAMVFCKLPEDTRSTARFCEALDALGDAIDRTAKRGRS